VVAGVRGTVFDINLDAGYIHSVDHVVSLKNSFFQSVEVMPGEVISAFDIFKKLASSAIDTTWQQANILRDEAYGALRAARLTEAWDTLAGSAMSDNW
jgi:hypothetical protein